MLLNASNRATIVEPVEQLSAMPTPQSNPSPSPTIDAGQNLASQSSRPVSGVNNLEMSYGTLVQLSEQGGVSVPQFARTVFQEINEQKFERANILLGRFRTMAAYFPFVVIPPTFDARIVLRERPFLFRTIMAAAEQNPNDQKDQVRDIMQYLALHLFQLGEKNLDMLLGVLVHIAWYVTMFLVVTPSRQCVLYRELTQPAGLTFTFTLCRNLRRICSMKHWHCFLTWDCIRPLLRIQGPLFMKTDSAGGAASCTRLQIGP
jgi:hypothetical protein